jgi:hypothetical protein
VKFLFDKKNPVVWSEPNISQIEAWSYAIYAWYQEFDFDFFFGIFFGISNESSNLIFFFKQK